MRIPTATDNQVQLNALPTVRRAALQDTRGESIGAGLKDVGSVVSQIQIEEKRKADASAVFEADMGLSQFHDSALQQAKTVKGKDAIGLTDRTLPEYDKLAAEQEKDIVSNRAKAIFKQQSQQRRQQLSGQLNQIEGTEREQYYQAQQLAYRDQEQNSAGLSYQDPKAIADSLARQDASTNVQYASQSEEAKVVARQENRTKTYSKVFDQMLADEDLTRAEHYFKAVEGDMDAATSANVKNSLRILHNRLDAKKDADIAGMKQGFSQEMQDIEAAFKARVPITSIPSLGRAQALFGAEKGKQLHETAQAMQHASIEAAKADNMSTTELVDLANSVKPTQQEGAALQSELHGVVSNVAASVIKERQDDPAGYLVNKSPAVQEAWNRFQNDGSDQSRNDYLTVLKGEQKRLQMPEAVIPNSYAMELASRISNPKSSEEMAGLIENESARWGKDWGTVLQQISKNVPDTAMVIGSGIERSAAVTLASMSKLKENDLKAMLPPDQKWSDVQASVASQFDEVRRSFPIDGTRTYQAIQSAAERLTVAYMQSGDSRSNSVKRAYNEVIANQYGIGELRDVPFLVPTKFDAGKVEDGAAIILENFKPTQEIAGDRPDRAEAAIKENGYFVASGDGKGLRLYLAGRPLPGAFYTWEQLSGQVKTYGPGRGRVQ